MKMKHSVEFLYLQLKKIDFNENEVKVWNVIEHLDLETQFAVIIVTPQCIASRKNKLDIIFSLICSKQPSSLILIKR